jgi:hypothetical protein
MRKALRPHPGARSDAADRIDVEAVRGPGGALRLRYTVTGRVSDILLPAKAAPLRTDELWKHTCFEAFIRTPSGGYVEFNFSPSSEWAAYRFRDYRLGMSDLPMDAPHIAAKASADRLEVDISFKLALPELAAAPGWRMAITAITEDVEAQKTYWALAHPEGKPDFHHDDGFVLDLPVEQT